MAVLGNGEEATMDAAIITQLRIAMRVWAAETHKTGALTVGDMAYDSDEARYLVDFAVKELGHWRVVEVWLEDREITLISDLGQGLPLAGEAWPWAAEPEFFATKPSRELPFVT